MVGPRGPSHLNRTKSRRRGLQAPTERHQHSQSGTRSQDHPPNASLHHAARTDAPSPNSPISVTSGRLHPPSRQSARMEMGHPSKATDDMAQGVPLCNMPRSKIPPPARAGRSHHGQPPEAPDRDGAAHPLRASRATTDIHHSEPTGGPGSAHQEKRPGGKVGPTSPFYVRNCQRTGT